MMRSRSFSLGRGDSCFDGIDIDVDINIDTMDNNTNESNSSNISSDRSIAVPVITGDRSQHRRAHGGERRTSSTRILDRSQRSTQSSDSNFSCDGSVGVVSVVSYARAQHRDRTLSIIRVLVICTLLCVAAIASDIAFILTLREEQRSFHEHLETFARYIVDGVITQLDTKYLLADSMASELSSAMSTSAWPNVTYAGFSQLCQPFSKLAKTDAIWYAPLVRKHEQAQYDSYLAEERTKSAYALGNHRPARHLHPLSSDRTHRSFSEDDADLTNQRRHVRSDHAIASQLSPEASQGGHLRADDDAAALNAHHIIHEKPNSTSINSNRFTNGIMFPIRQVSLSRHASNQDAKDLMQRDQLEDLTREEALVRMMQRRSAVFTKALPSPGPNASMHERYQTPTSALYFPIHRNISQKMSNGSASPSRTSLVDAGDDVDPNIVGALTLEFAWMTLLEGSTYTQEELLTVVLENSCEQQYTFTVTNGTVEYVGVGDLHGSEYAGPGSDTGYKQYEGFSIITMDSSSSRTVLRDDEESKDVPESSRHNQQVYPHAPTAFKSQWFVPQHSFCDLRVIVYPSIEMEDKYITDRPRHYEGAIALFFVSAAAIFIIYDCIVERKQKQVQASAQQNHDIVKSLFPRTVRDRLYAATETAITAPASKAPLPPLGLTAESPTVATSNKDAEKEDRIPIINDVLKTIRVSDMHTPRVRLKSFLTGNGFGTDDSSKRKQKKKRADPDEDLEKQAIEKEADVEVDVDVDVDISASPKRRPRAKRKLSIGHGLMKRSGSKNGQSMQDAMAQVLAQEPIADLFPNATILFAHISGFTPWSSEREPRQVFSLLENLFGAMDKIAHRYNVFKVETVADCYVAATGLPDLQPDHAVIMARFAHACQVHCRELVKVLEASLGPGTDDLALRIGIHSGPVTAGVLRGAGSRFQLFGDTMNTAARLESTGLRNRIHISRDTAELIRQAGKDRWLQHREGTVEAKGKGIMKTLWLDLGFKRPSLDANAKSGAASHCTNRAPSVGGANNAKHGSARCSDARLSDRIERLIQWNTDLLFGMLQRVVAQRKAPLLPKTTETALKDCADDLQICALDEVKEVLELPEFDLRVVGTFNTDVTMPHGVFEELNDFIRNIARGYQQANPFHNFEHASHVCLSASKLLRRIVNSDDVDYRMDSDDAEVSKVRAIISDLHNHTYGISSDALTHFSVVFCALIHDVGHTGVPNNQLAKEQPDVAVKYRGQSLAEQQSIDIAWKLLMTPSYKKLRTCIFSTDAEKFRFRDHVVNNILATDIFDPRMSTLRKTRWSKAFHEDARSLESCSLDGAEDMNRKATVVIEHIIQASDVAHTMQHWHVYRRWNQQLFREMHQAYAMGRSETNPSTKWYQGELWFFDNYVIPLAHKLKECGVFGVSSDEYLAYALANREEWAEKGQSIVDEMLKEIGD